MNKQSPRIIPPGALKDIAYSNITDTSLLSPDQFPHHSGNLLPDYVENESISISNTNN